MPFTHAFTGSNPVRITIYYQLIERTIIQNIFMYEILLIILICQTVTLMRLRGKTLEQLTNAQRAKLEQLHYKYLTSRRGRKKPMDVKDYLIVLQDKGLITLICTIIGILVYISAIGLFIYGYLQYV